MSENTEKLQFSYNFPINREGTRRRINALTYRGFSPRPKSIWVLFGAGTTNTVYGTTFTDAGVGISMKRQNQQFDKKGH